MSSSPRTSSPSTITPPTRSSSATRTRADFERGSARRRPADARSTLSAYWRFARRLPGFLRRRIGVEEARATVAQRLEQRDGAFLALVERGIFGNPGSPYRALLEHARCGLGDVRTMLAARGLEGTLQALREAGVYVSFEEFKGRVPIVRDGRVFAVDPRAFDNPWTAASYATQTGGSTGAGTRVVQDLEHLAAVTPLFMLSYHAHGVLGVPTAIWAGALPVASGINNVLRHSLMGNPVRRWYTPIVDAELRPSPKHRLATHAIVALGRALGSQLPKPEPLALEDALVLARWAQRTAAEQGRCMVRSSVSTLLRLAVVARERGVGLEGVTCVGGGEPPTPGKVERILATGARWLPGYVFSETGPVGYGCANPQDCNDLHLFSDALAVIQHARSVPGTSLEVRPFLYTTLLPTAPKLMLNVESDDYGVIERRACGCPLEAAGFTLHLRDIRSFSKLTAEGMTLVGSDMLRVLDDVLPARFGGSPLDYQLAEIEDASGYTRLELRIAPSLGPLDEQVVVRTVLDTLAQLDFSGRYARAAWSEAGTLRVARRAPEWTAAGKLMPLRVAARRRD